jgi:hypothetical protein
MREEARLLICSLCLGICTWLCNMHLMCKHWNSTGSRRISWSFALWVLWGLKFARSRYLGNSILLISMKLSKRFLKIWIFVVQVLLFVLAMKPMRHILVGIMIHHPKRSRHIEWAINYNVGVLYFGTCNEVALQTGCLLSHVNYLRSKLEEVWCFT